MFINVEYKDQALNLAVLPETDFDSEFVAVCLDTGEGLKVQGWLIEDMIVFGSLAELKAA